MTYAIEALYKTDKLFPSRLNALENTTAVLAKATFIYLQSLKTRINRHDEDSEIMDRNLQYFLKVTNSKLYRMTMTINSHHLSIKMLTKVFRAYTEVLRKYMGFYDTYSGELQSLLAALDTLSITPLTHKKADPAILERYPGAIHMTYKSFNKL